MSDFDKTLRDRLNEEAEFAGMEQNWQSLAARLNPPAPPGGLAGFWQWLLPAALLALLLLNGWLGAMLWQLRRENVEIRQSVADTAQPGQAATAAPDTVFTSRVIVHTDTVWRTVYVMPRIREAAAPEQPGSDEAGVFLSEKAPAPSQNVPEKMGQANAPKPGSQAAAGDVSGKTIAQTAGQTSAKPIENQPAAAQQTAAAATNNPAKTPVGTSQPNVADSRTAQTLTEKEAAQTAALPTEPRPENPVADAAQPAEKVADLPKASSKVDSSTAIVPELPTAEAVPAPEPKPEDFDASAGAVPIKKYRKSWLRLTDFAVGTNYTTGVPLVKDVKPWQGAGFQVQVNFARDFRLNLTADWTRLNYSGPNFDEKLNFPKPPDKPGGPGGPERFDRVEVVQKRHQTGLRIEYLFPVTGGLQPFLSAGYAWQRVAAQDAKYYKREPHGGNEIMETRTAAPQVFDSNWTVGFGVEWQGKHFGVGTSAEFVNNLDKKTLNLPIVRAGVKYKF
ncbi:MAG: hypothetical protein ACK4Q5_11110 [Saprospiraceae bacterium]